jgi:hypothetical protein
MIANTRTPFLHIAGWSAIASGVVAISGLLPVLTVFVFGVNVPRLNDSAVIVQYLLALPITLALHPVAQARAPLQSWIAMLLGIVGILGVAVVQVLWLSETFGWTTYIMLIGTAMLMVGAWVVITGSSLRRPTAPLRQSLLMSMLAATYVAYPIWAFWLGRQLLSGKLAASGPASEGGSARVEARPFRDPEGR